MRRTADAIDALLPQTQCTRCGYAGCRPYAEAIEAGLADIDRCPPGGAATIEALSRLLQRPAKPLNPAFGREQPPRVAWIDAQRCIGCAKCLPPCPVDAILGAAKFLHSVIEQHCTGCELCLAPCPVDCIQMRAPDPGATHANDPHGNRLRHDAHVARERRRQSLRTQELARAKGRIASAARSP